MLAPRVLCLFLAAAAAAEFSAIPSQGAFSQFDIVTSLLCETVGEAGEDFPLFCDELYEIFTNEAFSISDPRDRSVFCDCIAGTAAMLPIQASPMPPYPIFIFDHVMQQLAGNLAAVLSEQKFFVYCLEKPNGSWANLYRQCCEKLQEMPVFASCPMREVDFFIENIDLALGMEGFLRGIDGFLGSDEYEQLESDQHLTTTEVFGEIINNLL